MQQTLFDLGKPTPSQPEKKQSLISRQELNEAQYEAVTTINGPILVIAGAGSGKTRTLVYRTAHLIDQGVAPENILLLTFTRKAAHEMTLRATELLNESCQRVAGGTFHAMASLLLRRYGHNLGYPSNFTIIDQADAEGIINLLKSSLNMAGMGKQFPSKRAIITIFSRAVNKDLSLDEVLHHRFRHFVEFSEELHTILKHYRQFKMDHALMDYDDLLVNLRQVMADFEPVRQEISRQYTYVMVDEYQDTNHMQADIVRLIAGPQGNVMAVGDDSQSIYSFRGADFRNIMEFPNLFENTKVIRLEENYRSTQPILSMTNAIIEQAAEKYTKKLYSKIEGTDKPLVHGARNEDDQARFIVRQIKELHDKGTPLSEMAVLFRSGFHSYRLEMELTNNRIRFEKRGGLKLTESAHTKDVLSFLRLVVNPKDNLSWNRLLLLIPKLGPKTATKILTTVKESDDPLAGLTAYPAAKGWKDEYSRLMETMKGLFEPHLTPLQCYELALDYYRPVFERIYHDDYPHRSQDLEQLRDILAGCPDLETFVNDTALDPPEPALTDQDLLFGDDDSRLILSTIHSAKGLEWDTVFVINLVEGKFPSGMAKMGEELEEERRLLYVASTRARKQLYLLYPTEILSPERYTQPGVISRFLGEIPNHLTASVRRGPPATPSYDHLAPSNSSSGGGTANAGAKSTEVTTGCRVRHGFFGQGRVVQVTGPRTVKIFFDRHGEKIINLDYAKLEIV